jgi:hypothetical protein
MAGDSVRVPRTTSVRACANRSGSNRLHSLAEALPNLGELRVAELHDSDAWAGSLELDVEHRVELDAVGSHAGLAVNAVEESHSRHGHRHVDLLEP